MNILIVYATRHGCAEKCVEKLSYRLTPHPVTTANLKHNQIPSLDAYPGVIIGGSIHAGKVQKSVKAFCQKHAQVLRSKRLGLFLCCMEEGAKAQEQFSEAFPSQLRDHAAAGGLLGGEFDFDRMNFLERSIVKKVAGVESSVSRIEEEAIDRFARDFLDK